MSGHCEECGNTICICAEANHDVIERPWVELTDEEVEGYWDWEDWQIGAGRLTVLKMVRHIEAKLKEKNT
jgi:hypothetical protein